MSLLARIFGAVPKEERGGISIGDAVAYTVSGIKDLPDFLSALPDLLPQNSILYLEGASAPDVIGFLQRHPAKETCKVAVGTIWPKPTFFHVPITSEIMDELASLSDHYADPEVCIHLHAYKDATVLLEWHDAFDQELLISREIAEGKVGEFCRRLGARYEKAGGRG